jgi:molecular chaperone DnaJ
VIPQEDRLQVQIPAGVEDGATLRVNGRGEGSARGGRPGNLYVSINVAADPRFERDGADLHCEIDVTFPQAALGTRRAVPTLDDDETIDIARGSQPGDTIILRGKGLPHLRERRHGDLIVHLRLVVPESLTSDQEDRLRAFAEALGEVPVAPTKKKAGFFGRKKKG